MQFDKFLSHFFLLMLLLANATSPWGQSWERIRKSNRAYITALVPQDCPHGEIRHTFVFEFSALDMYLNGLLTKKLVDSRYCPII